MTTNPGAIDPFKGLKEDAATGLDMSPGNTNSAWAVQEIEALRERSKENDAAYLQEVEHFRERAEAAETREAEMELAASARNVKHGKALGERALAAEAGMVELKGALEELMELVANGSYIGEQTRTKVYAALSATPVEAHGVVEDSPDLNQVARTSYAGPHSPHLDTQGVMVMDRRGRVGMVMRSTVRTCTLTYGAGGPIATHYKKSLKVATEEEVKLADLEGVGHVIPDPE